MAAAKMFLIEYALFFREMSEQPQQVLLPSPPVSPAREDSLFIKDLRTSVKLYIFWKLFINSFNCTLLSRRTCSLMYTP